MKRMTAFLLAGALWLGLAGCAAPLPPAKAADGLDWSENWITVGGVVGVDTPEGMDHRENNEALAADGMYYAAWSMGEAEPYTNEDGDEVPLYDAQVYLLLGGHRSAQDAQRTLAQWKEMAEQRYTVESAAQENHGGVEFAVITYTFPSETNPYARGASAFGVYGSYALSVEFACRQDFDGDGAQLLGEFLDSCHYAAP